MASHLSHSDHPLDEMSIVDIFTRLIFDAESSLEGDEAWVVEILCQIEPGLSTANRRDLSEYLRAMGVEEMIQTVGRLKQFMEQQMGVVANQGNTLRRNLRHR